MPPKRKQQDAEGSANSEEKRSALAEKVVREARQTAICLLDVIEKINNHIEHFFLSFELHGVCVCVCMYVTHTVCDNVCVCVIYTDPGGSPHCGEQRPTNQDKWQNGICPKIPNRG